mmetsp:Transcript_20858/g.34356  ORF Transcript_20858/g.34356 Transcript_20858/m.34356 type:complete len:134 (-) Transcript_20858:919-1320(-)
MIYPLFKYFEEWCQDENRHGDFLDALLRSQRSWLDGLQSKLWCRFFLLSVFATMYLNDLQRAGFYGSLGIDARSYDKEVIIKTNETAAKVWENSDTFLPFRLFPFVALFFPHPWQQCTLLFLHRHRSPLRRPI